MNLLLLAVWCGLLLKCTVSLPRRRQIKYPVTKSQNSHYERSHPTALEVLERTLLRPSDRGLRRSHPHSGRKRSANHCPVIQEKSTSPLYPESLGDISENKEDSKIDTCVASFGADSPLCKPRKRQKKSFFGIPDIHKRPFRSGSDVKKNMPITTVNTGIDFFGIFKSSTANESFSSKLNSPTMADTTYGFLLSAKVTSSEPSSLSVKRETTQITQIPMTQMVTSDQPTYATTAIRSEYVRAAPTDSTDAASKNEAGKIILPGIVQRIESEPQSLYIEQDDSPKDDQKSDSNSNKLNEAESDVAYIGVTAISEENSVKSNITTQTRIPPLKTSFLTGKTYSKDTCESDTKKKCICSFSSVDSDFQTIFSKARFEEEIMVEVSNMRCRQYDPEPSVFDLNTNAKPRVLKGKHTPFAVDNRKGAKEVTEKSLDEFIAFSVIDDGITRVFVSADVKIPCFPKPDIHLSSTDADHVKYTWSFGNKKQSITEGRITQDDGDGTLIIQDIELTDSKNYTCEIDYIHPDTGERTTDTFVHSLSVVTLPTVSARAMVHFKSTAACDESLLEMFEMFLPQQVEKTICSPGNKSAQLCSVVIHSPICHSETSESAQEKSKRDAAYELYNMYREKRESSMEMSLNYDVFVHRPVAKELPGLKAKLCNPDCHLLINFKLIQLLKESMQEVALIPIISKVQDGGTFTPEPSSLKVKYIFGCIGGYFLESGFCLACPKGTYSDDGATECQACPIHTYSGTVGARKCTPCKHLWMPICNESFESLNIMMIIYVVGGVILLLSCFIVYYVFWYKGHTWKELLKKGPKEKVAKSERVKSRKEAKRLRDEREAAAKIAEKEAKRKSKASQEELERLLVSSAESETEA